MNRNNILILLVSIISTLSFAQNNVEVHLEKLDDSYTAAVVVKTDSFYKPIGILENQQNCDSTVPSCETFNINIPNASKETQAKNMRLLLGALDQQQTTVRVCSLYSRTNPESANSKGWGIDVYMQQVVCKLENRNGNFNAVTVQRVNPIKAPLTPDQTRKIDTNSQYQLHELLEITNEVGFTQPCTMVVGYYACGGYDESFIE